MVKYWGPFKGEYKQNQLSLKSKLNLVIMVKTTKNFMLLIFKLSVNFDLNRP